MKVVGFAGFSGSGKTTLVEQLIPELRLRGVRVLVEGFKDSDLLKIEVWRAPEPGQVAKPVRYPEDDFVVAVATDAPQGLPVPTQLPLLDLNSPAQVVDWLLQYEHRFEYNWGLHGGLVPCAPQ